METNEPKSENAEQNENIEPDDLNEPVTAQPVTAQPVTAQPVTAQPVMAQPVTAQPVTAQPVTAQPITAQPVTAQPVTAQPVTAQPVTTQPVTAQPVTAQPVTAQPVTAQPVTAQPVAAQPVTAQPVTAQPVAAQPVTAQPVTAQPVTAQPVTAQPVMARPPIGYGHKRGKSRHFIGFLGIAKFILKMKIFLIVAVLSAVGFVMYKSGLYELMAKPWSKPERVTVMNGLPTMKEINRLYTGFYLVPVMDISYGVLKSDWVLHQVFSDSELPQVPKGFILKQYDVAFGYDNVLDLLQDEAFMGRVCSGGASALPAPKILSTNGKSTEIYGKYTGTYENLDMNRQSRDTAILQALKRGEAYANINERGKKSLHSLASILCR
jgi:hypothetical protein